MWTVHRVPQHPFPFCSGYSQTMIDLKPGAANAVRTCMAVGPGDRVVIVGDEARKRIADAIVEECDGVGAPVTTFVIEDYMSRPATGYPDKMAEDLEEFKPTVSFFIAQSLEGELAFRRPYMEHVLYRLKLRHGHMVGIDERLMAEGMTADYNEIARITHAVTDVVRSARHIEVQTPSGTDMAAEFDPSRRRWNPCPGLYHEQGKWGNLPEGETFTSPMRVDGVIGAEVLGDHFSQKYGVLASPARFELADSRVRKVTSDDSALAKELDAYLTQHENSNRVGEYAIGTNVALKSLSGNLLQDEKVPGVHVAFGYPYPEETGADWTCPSHLDVVATRSTIKVDGQYLMKDGSFVI